MTQEETTKILAILKAAYPNSYKGMTKDEAYGVIGVWSMQFADMPYFIVAIAVNKLIGTNTFPPAIKEVKDKLRSVYFEAQNMLDEHRRATEGFTISNDPNAERHYLGKPLEPKTLAACEEIVKRCSSLAYSNSLEPKLNNMLSSSSEFLLDA